MDDDNIYIMDNDEIFMMEACKLSELSIKRGGGPFGAVITYKNIIVGRGHNMVTINNDPTQHAEVVAIRDACKNMNTYDLSNCNIYTSCEPCPMCLGSIYWARISNIYYGNNRTDAKNIGFDDEEIYNEINKPLNERKIPIKQCDIKCRHNAFNTWKNKLDKQHY